MNALRRERKIIIAVMALFFITGVIGRIIENEIAVKAGFLLAIISAIFVIILTFQISKDDKK